MVDFQLATGCRPGEACSIRTADITMHDGVWLYRPWTYKTEHQDIERVIYLGPRAQEIIRPWLRCDLDKPLFSPREAREAYLATRRKNAKRKPRKASPKRQPGEVYTNNTYARAILKACKRGGLPHWAPNQLRHTAGTEIRRQFGAEMARLILGHQKLSTTELYAEADFKRAIEIVSLVG
jgi:integrase